MAGGTGLRGLALGSGLESSASDFWLLTPFFGIASNPSEISMCRLDPIFGGSPRCSRRLQACALAAAMLLPALSVHAQEIRLYRKDGSYTLVKSYQVQGDKIRFYNLDAGEWEEMPVSLVDFDATKRAQQQEANGNEKTLEQAKAFDKQRFEASAAAPTGFAVAPGRYLPTTEGVYAYDGLRVIPLIQSQGEVVTDKERAVLSMAIPAPLLKKRALVELPGTQAAVRLTNPQPVFYIQANDQWGAKAELIPVKSGRSSRVLEKLQSGMGVGASGEVRNAVALERTEVAKNVLKLQPAKPLAPGEYALAELIEGKLNLDVWDFGIDKPGKKTAPAADTRERQSVMGEQRPEQTPQASTPTDVILHRCDPNQPCQPMPTPDAVPPSPQPPNLPGGNGTGQPAGPPN
jgi:hypothetical protein